MHVCDYFDLMREKITVRTESDRIFLEQLTFDLVFYLM